MPTIDQLKLVINADPVPVQNFFKSIQEAARAASRVVTTTSNEAAKAQEAMGEAAEQAAEQAAKATQEWTDVVQEAAKAQDKLGDAVEDTAGKVADGAKAAHTFGAAIKGLGDPLKQLDNRLAAARAAVTKWAEATEEKFKAFKESALTLGAAGASVGLTMAGAVKVFGEFEGVLNGIVAVSGATAEDMDQIRERALQLGADTQFSAKAAADAFFELSKSGFTVKEQMGAIAGVMDLAAAGQMKVGEASEISAGILRGFGLEAAKAADVADQLAQAANSSALDVGDVAESMKYIAPVARASSQSLEEMMGVLAALGDQTIKGEQAGTSMRSILLALQAPSGDAAKQLQVLGVSVADTHGKMLPLTDIIQQFRERTGKMSETQRNAAIETVFGKESLSAFLALMNTAPEKMKQYIANQEAATGAAKNMADGLNKGVNFQLEQMKGSVETLAIKIGSDLAPAFGNLLGIITNLVNALAAIPAPFRMLIEFATGAAAITASLSAVIGGVVAVLPALAAGFAALTGPVGLTTIAIGLLGAAAVALIGSFRDAQRASDNAGAATYKQIGNVEALTKRYKELSEKVNRTKEEEKERQQILDQIKAISPDLVSGYDAQGRAIDLNTTKTREYIKALKEKLELENQDLKAKRDQAKAALDDADARLRQAIADARTEEARAGAQSPEFKAQQTSSSKLGHMVAPDVAAEPTATTPAINPTGVQDNTPNAPDRVAELRALVDRIRTERQAAQADFDKLNRQYLLQTGQLKPDVKGAPQRGAVAGSKGTELHGFDLLKAQHDAGMGHAEFISKAQALQKQYGKTTKEYLEIGREIKAAKEAMARGETKSAKGLTNDVKAIVDDFTHHAQRVVADGKTAIEQDTKAAEVAVNKLQAIYKAAPKGKRGDQVRHNAEAGMRSIYATLGKDEAQEYATQAQEQGKTLLQQIADLEGLKARISADVSKRKLPADVAGQAMSDLDNRIAGLRRQQAVAQTKEEKDFQTELTRIQEEGQRNRRAALTADLADLAQIEGMSDEARLSAFRDYMAQVEATERAAAQTKRDAYERELKDKTKNLPDQKARVEQGMAAYDATATPELNERLEQARKQGMSSLTQATIDGLDDQISAHKDRLERLKDQDNGFFLFNRQAIQREIDQIAAYQRKIAELKKASLDDVASRLRTARPDAAHEVDSWRMRGGQGAPLSADAKALNDELVALDGAKTQIDQNVNRLISGMQGDEAKRQREEFGKWLVTVVQQAGQVGLPMFQAAMDAQFQDVRKSASQRKAEAASSLADTVANVGMMTGNPYIIAGTQAVKIITDIWNMQEKANREAIDRYEELVRGAIQAMQGAFTSGLNTIKTAFNFQDAMVTMDMGLSSTQRAEKVAENAAAEAKTYSELVDTITGLQKAEQDNYARMLENGAMSMEQYQQAMTSSTQFWTNQRVQIEQAAIAKIQQMQQAILTAAEPAMARKFMKDVAAMEKSVNIGTTNYSDLQSQEAANEAKFKRGGYSDDDKENQRLYWEAQRQTYLKEAAYLQSQMDLMTPGTKAYADLQGKQTAILDKANKLGLESVQQASSVDEAMANLQTVIGDDKKGTINSFRTLADQLEAFKEKAKTWTNEQMTAAAGVNPEANAKKATNTLELGKLEADFEGKFNWANRWQTGWDDANNAGIDLVKMKERAAALGASPEVIAKMEKMIKELRDGSWYHFKPTWGGDTNFKFAKGGVVPGTGYGDTVRALLSPKEMVLPRELSERIMRGVDAGHRVSDYSITNSHTRNVTVQATLNLGGIHTQTADARSLARTLAPELAKVVREQLA